MLRLASILCLLFTAPTAWGQEAPVAEADRRALIESARSVSGFDRGRGELDLLRTLAGADVRLTPQEQLEMAKRALSLGLSIEAEAVLALLAAAKDPLLAEPPNVRMRELAQKEAAQDRRGSLEQDAAIAGSGRFPVFHAMVPIAESFLAMGEHQRAIDLLRTALASNRLADDLAATARLSLCRALLAAGRPSEARWELENFRAAPGYGVLAKVWLTIAIEAEKAAPTSSPSSPPPP